jgi:hypothetical protein
MSIILYSRHPGSARKRAVLTAVAMATTPRSADFKEIDYNVVHYEQEDEFDEVRRSASFFHIMICRLSV